MRILSVFVMTLLTVVSALGSNDADLIMSSTDFSDDPIYQGPDGTMVTPILPRMWTLKLDGSGGLGKGGTMPMTQVDQSEYVKITKLGDVNVVDLLKKGSAALDGIDLNEPDVVIVRSRQPGQVGFSEVGLSRGEALMLELADYQGLSEVRQKLMSKLSSDSFDPKKLKTHPALKGFGRTIDGKGPKNALAFLKENYPGLIDGESLNLAAVDKAQMDQEAKDYGVYVQCAPEKEDIAKTPNPCSRSRVWAAEDTKQIFKKFKKYFHENRTRTGPNVYIDQKGKYQIFASWKSDGKGAQFQSAKITTKGCSDIELFSFPESIKELFATGSTLKQAKPAKGGDTNNDMKVRASTRRKRAS